MQVVNFVSIADSDICNVFSHETRKTQFENPVTSARRHHDANQNSYYDDDDRPVPYRMPPSFSSATAQAKAQEAEAMSR